MTLTELSKFTTDYNIQPYPPVSFGRLTDCMTLNKLHGNDPMVEALFIGAECIAHCF